ncbi:MarR family winged helix-turn-helix transcriptional regulator [Ferrimicrobium sp.]|uniref:MarR family winged helix-turn-helix transcriptional regulator n=1 Tax=Ferrimicrobium sp. TaxID=2926050 RepID=UPI0026253D0A|nr:MarR family winged helix-turn-helix transcriptional regulator [Ferrimicrobium sp.]
MDELASDLGFRLSRVARQLRTQWGERLSTISLNQPQAAMLRALEGGPSLGLRELSRIIGADPSNLRREIERLNKRDLLVVETPQRTGFKATLSLTLAGTELAKETRRLAQDQMAATMDRLTSAERVGLAKAIAKLEALTGITQVDPEDNYGQSHPETNQSTYS